MTRRCLVTCSDPPHILAILNRGDITCARLPECIRHRMMFFNMGFNLSLHCAHLIVVCVGVLKHASCGDRYSAYLSLLAIFRLRESAQMFFYESFIWWRMWFALIGVPIFFSNSYAHADILLHNAQLHSTYNFLPFLLTSAAVKRSCKIVTCEKHEIVFVPWRCMIDWYMII